MEAVFIYHAYASAGADPKPVIHHLHPVHAVERFDIYVLGAFQAALDVKVINA